MGKQIFIGYFIITLLVSVYQYEFGKKSYMGYMFNLGRSVMWPVLLIEAL
jgi:hypothetical protein